MKDNLKCQPSAKEVCLFLADYSDWLFSSGSTCIRLEKNVSRMAATLGMDIELFIMPRHINLTVKDSQCKDCYTSINSIKDRGISFNINTLLSRLSWDMADGKLDFYEARKSFRKIIKYKGDVNSWLLAVLVAIANASFCRLFGGSFVSMLIIFVSVFMGYSLKQFLLERKVDVRIVVIICAFVSAVLSSSDYLFSIGSTPDLTIGSSVLYLVPGIPFINSFCDMIDKHYICAFGRLMNALVLTCCLSLGLLLGMIVMGEGMF